MPGWWHMGARYPNVSPWCPFAEEDASRNHTVGDLPCSLHSAAPRRGWSCSVTLQVLAGPSPNPLRWVGLCPFPSFFSMGKLRLTEGR